LSSSDYKDDGTNILLDANENAMGPSLPSAITSASSSSQIDFLGLNRYPDPHQPDLKSRLIALRNTHKHTLRNLAPENLFVGVGSDECIDALLRCFCIPAKDKILVCPPTYGMYGVSAQVNDVALVKVPLMGGPDWHLDVRGIMEILTADSEKADGEGRVKLVYVCSPGNPTGALINKPEVEALLRHPTWNGIVVLDEAYIDFAPENSSLAEWVAEWENLVVLQTLSKAFGLAGIRLGAAFASEGVAALLNNLKAPYNISSPTSVLACQALSSEGLNVMRQNRALILAQRRRLIVDMPKIKGVGRFRGGEDSNFLLVEICDQQGKPSNEVSVRVYERLAEGRGVVVRFRGKEAGCEGCLRITVGTEKEVERFLGEVGKVVGEVWQELDRKNDVNGFAANVEAKRESDANGVLA
jgi:histidinol-phosphate aminotransferase